MRLVSPLKTLFRLSFPPILSRIINLLTNSLNTHFRPVFYNLAVLRPYIMCHSRLSLASKLLIYGILLAFSMTTNGLVKRSLVLAASSNARTNTDNLPKKVIRLTSVEGITEYRLKNGLRILLFPDKSKPTITVNMTYLVGSLHENYGETGMAHLLEHLLFKGSAKHPDIPKELSEHGAQPNGTTWFDRTNYFETFSATDENLEWALDLEADRMINSFISKKDLKSEMTVVRNEFEMGENSPLRILMQRTLSTAFLWHNYGKSTIGARSDIENVSIKRLRAFYRRYYQPDNAILLVVGKFNEIKTLNLIINKFSSIPHPTRILREPYTFEPTQDGERSITLRRTGEVQLLIAIYHIPSGSHLDFPACDVLAQILGDSPSGRLHKALVQTNKASRVFGFNYQLRDPGVAMIGAEIRKQESIEEAKQIMLQTAENLHLKPPTEKEVERARIQLLKQIDLTLNDASRVGLGLSEWMAMGDWRLFFLNRDRIKKITHNDVLRVASLYLKTSNRTLGQFIPTVKPDRSKIPQKPDVGVMLKDYKGNPTISVGEAFDPSTDNIESRVRRISTGSNLKLAILSKKTRGETVFASIRLRFGNAESLTGYSTAGDLVAPMLMRGTNKNNRQQIQDKFDLLKARVRFSGGISSVRISVETIKKNLSAVLILIGEILKEPSFPVKEFKTLKQEVLAAIEQQRTDPKSIVYLTFRRHFRPYPRGHVLYVPTFDEEISDLNSTTLENVKEFYDNFYGASHGEIGISGDFNSEEIIKVLKNTFGTWENPTPYQRIKNPFLKINPVNQFLEIPDKANAVFAAGQLISIDANNKDYPALVLGNYMLGGGFLNSRLAVRIRQKEGLSYGIRSYLNVGTKDKRGSFSVHAITAPQNVEKVESAFNQEIQRALNHGFALEEIAAAKSGYLQVRQVMRAQDRNLSDTLAERLFENRTLLWDKAFEESISALTNKQIQTALQRYLAPDQFTIIKAGSFSKLGKD